ncbi:MAG: D-mannose-1-phosphate guanyltransferase, partial [Bacteroidales bacterium]|nr:D-mannose-1-phosphate guanyltransferase [Bacteroidales bacterium]
VNEVPKSMALINNKPFLEYQLKYLETYKIKRVILSVGFKKEIIQKHFQNKFNSIELDYAIENKPLGTGGGIKKAFKLVKSNSAFVLNGDTLFRVNLKKLSDFHKAKHSELSIVLRELENIERFGTVKLSDDNRIIDFMEKNSKKGKGLINGGIYLINKKFFLDINLPDKFSIEKDCFEKIYKTKDIYGMLSKEYFLDIGIPEDYQKAQNEFKQFEY